MSPLTLSRVRYPGTACESTARLSDREILSVSRSDLPDMIRAAGIRPQDIRVETADLDDGEVAVLARILRRCCRLRMRAYAAAHGKVGHWMDAHVEE